jgi:hypothetical protein
MTPKVNTVALQMQDDATWTPPAIDKEFEFLPNAVPVGRHEALVEWRAFSQIWPGGIFLGDFEQGESEPDLFSCSVPDGTRGPSRQASRLRSRTASSDGTSFGVLQMTTCAEILWIILGTGLACATPAMAQTYDPNYPVCIQVYAFGGGYIDCSFTSIAQCNATASGRGARCYANPYFAPRVQSARRY